MMEEYIAFRSFFDQFVELQDDEMLEVASILERVVYDKNDTILKEGVVDQYIYFLYEGIVRLYYTHEKHDYSVMFFSRQGILSSFISFSQQVPSPVSLQAVTPTILFRAEKSKIDALYAKSHRIETMGRLITEFLLIEIMEKYLDLLTLKTNQRYEKLVEEWGERKMRMVSIKYISSFLRVKPESLSRIRKQYKEN